MIWPSEVVYIAKRRGGNFKPAKSLCLLEHICIHQTRTWWHHRHGNSNSRVKNFFRWGPHPKGFASQTTWHRHFSTTIASGGLHYSYWICHKEQQKFSEKMQNSYVWMIHSCIMYHVPFSKAPYPCTWMAAHRSSVWHLSLWVCDPVHVCNTCQPGWVKSGGEISCITVSVIINLMLILMLDSKWINPIFE